MQPHLICLDLDGTLLNDNKEISNYTKQVLNELQQRGHYIMIATGRPYRASQIYYHELNLTTPIVNFNGAYVHHPKDKTFNTVHEILDLNVARNIIQGLQQYQVSNIIAEVKDYVFINNHDPRLFEGFSMGNPRIQTGNLLVQLNESPTSLLIEAEEDKIPEIKEMLTHIYANHIEHRRWGAPFPVIEIVKRGINKARGIEQARQFLNVDAEHIIAFGDEDNDTEMIEYARYGVAMDNGLTELKEVANNVTYSNNDDGIGRYLNDFFNLNMRYYF
ncbi:Cof-type HAD-IIB family hydrolase [Staphylococcus simiae]|uniref:HAD superfamily hydrolase n=1 Tax=Staphylococcus simiae CCM 7213 = CCUG 51256 TaxID=911238 RepID=G5JMB5_9STAP|nr:Cof-type HAD-IIB family hydrolase [Staphylococcus simiae]EHJ06674.1 HAD superfamily hydrolase [Staphylococcus simiae CCM 7213 = CCUG 51256]PNZ12786.1 Cof-type HAD-IIB family hydrolase [Staphylococcus simiae]SNV66223.1 hydrolase [Staphylococcus simiae]